MTVLIGWFAGLVATAAAIALGWCVVAGQVGAASDCCPHEL